jgi:uncharacterized protein
MKISKQVFRRFIAGKQGLWPGRRWHSLEGVRQAIRSGCVIQIDPLCVLARSHDLALHARVANYNPNDLLTAVYSERLGFDWGGTVFIHPMQHIPYYRAIMNRMSEHDYWRSYRDQYQDAIRQVEEMISRAGPQSNRSFGGNKLEDRYWRTGKDTGRALYYEWMTGRMMTAYRKGFERFYDFAMNIIPVEYAYDVTIDEAEEFFARQIFDDRNAITSLEFKNAWSERIARKVDLKESGDKLDGMVRNGALNMIEVDGLKNPYYVLAGDVLYLEVLASEGIPEEWNQLVSDNSKEVLFLAPLEIISARGRAMQVFDFEYLWEVYKPIELRRWGYYTIPVMYQDRLVARFDSKVDRKASVLQILQYWQEDNFQAGADYEEAFMNGIKQLQRLVGAAEAIGLPL